MQLPFKVKYVSGVLIMNSIWYSGCQEVSNELESAICTSAHCLTQAEADGYGGAKKRFDQSAVLLKDAVKLSITLFYVN